MAPLVTATSLTSLIVALADLREEGAVLVPEVFLCDDLSALLKLLPGNERLFIGTQADAQTAVAEALKKCAPLAIGGWCMFVTRSVEGFRYGLFRGSFGPLSISVNQTLFSSPLEQIKVVRLIRTATGCVELRNHHGNVHSILLNDKPETSPLPQVFVAQLVDLICEQVVDESKDPTRTYLSKVLGAALASCHGTLVAVSKSKKVPKFLADGVVLQTPIDLAAAVGHVSDPLAYPGAEHQLLANGWLLKGMIASDGITVFSDDGKLLAYNCFIASPNKVAGKVVIGGARTRAYGALCARVGKELRGAFIQSQDGWTKYQEA